MFFLMGERVRRSLEPSGSRHCAVCSSDQAFSHATEVNFFTLFAVALLPIETVADYEVCNRCESAYADAANTEPSQVAGVRLVTTYIMTGYGMQNQVRIIQEIARSISGFDFPSSEIQAISRGIEDEDVFKLLEASAVTMNDRAKLQVLQAAFLSTHVCCEIQYEDRLRINLMGNALGVSLQFVEYAIEEVRCQRYYGVNRLLTTTEL